MVSTPICYRVKKLNKYEMTELNNILCFFFLSRVCHVLIYDNNQRILWQRNKGNNFESKTSFFQKKSSYSKNYPYHKPWEIGWTLLWGELEKIAHFEKLKISAVFIKTAKLFLGQIWKASLSEFPEIYAHIHRLHFQLI